LRERGLRTSNYGLHDGIVVGLRHIEQGGTSVKNGCARCQRRSVLNFSRASANLEALDGNLIEEVASNKRKVGPLSLVLEVCRVITAELNRALNSTARGHVEAEDVTADLSLLVKLVIVHRVGGVHDAAESDESILASEALLAHTEEEVEACHLVEATRV